MKMSSEHLKKKQAPHKQAELGNKKVITSRIMMCFLPLKNTILFSFALKRWTF